MRRLDKPEKYSIIITGITDMTALTLNNKISFALGI